MICKFWKTEVKINHQVTSIPEICQKLELGRVSIKSLGKDIQIRIISQIRIRQTTVFPAEVKGRLLKKWDRKNIEAFELQCWRRQKIQVSRDNRSKTKQKRIIEYINPEFYPKVQMARLKLSYFGPIVERPNFLEKSLM